MNIKILDSWLKDYLKTNATPYDFAHAMSLTSVSIERMEKVESDVLYDIEITTNRPDLMSVVGLAREASAVLPQFGFKAEFIPPKTKKPKDIPNQQLLTIKNNDKLVNRILAVVMEVEIKPSPKNIQERLETSDIRSLNNVIDITNYVMREAGHPTHVFDYDLLKTKTLVIRESRKNEKIKTLDGKEYVLQGGDIVADDGLGNIVDLLGIMGLENSVVTEQTKRIVFFIDNLDAVKVRKTSMQHGIRTEAAQLNEKVVNPETAYQALLYGIYLYQEIADGKLLSDIIDIYPNKIAEKKISVSINQINKVIGVEIPTKTILEILEKLGFNPVITPHPSPLPKGEGKSASFSLKGEGRDEGYKITVIVPHYRASDINIPEDIIEEVARVYGYHNIPTQIPSITSQQITKVGSDFDFEQMAKLAMKYWGFTEVYTYPLVSEEMFEGPLENAVTLANPLGEDFAYMRNTLIPSLLKVTNDNKNIDDIKIFEIASVYLKQKNHLPIEQLHFAALIKKPHASFFVMKGIVEQMANDLGIKNLIFKPGKEIDTGADVYLRHPDPELVEGEGSKKDSTPSAQNDDIFLGTIEILDEQIITCELNFAKITQHATTKKIYTPISKYPEVLEDLAFVISDDVLTSNIIDEIKKQNPLISDVSLLDKYQNTKTFHIIYHSNEKSLTNEEVGKIREKIVRVVKEKFNATVKE